MYAFVFPHMAFQTLVFSTFADSKHAWNFFVVSNIAEVSHPNTLPLKTNTTVKNFSWNSQVPLANFIKPSIICICTV